MTLSVICSHYCLPYVSSWLDSHFLIVSTGWLFQILAKIIKYLVLNYVIKHIDNMSQDQVMESEDAS